MPKILIMIEKDRWKLSVSKKKSLMKSLNCTNVLWNVVMRETGRENPRSLAYSPQKYLKGSDNKIGSLLQFFWGFFFFNPHSEEPNV